MDFVVLGEDEVINIAGYGAGVHRHHFLSSHVVDSLSSFGGQNAFRLKKRPYFIFSFGERDLCEQLGVLESEILTVLHSPI